jgi:hypothetical protein
MTTRPSRGPDVRTGSQRTAESDREGRFTLPGLPVGPYEVKA